MTQKKFPFNPSISFAIICLLAGCGPTHAMLYTKEFPRSAFLKKFNKQRKYHKTDEMGGTAQHAHKSLYLTGNRLHTAINKEKPVSTVYCPVGILQTLALLSAISEEPIRQEIKEFSKNNKIVEDITTINQLIKKFEVSSSLPDKDNDIKFRFTNAVYALLSSSLNFNKTVAAPLESIGAQLMEVDFSEPSAAAAKLNKIVEQDTRGKITELLTEEDLSPDSIFVLLHTLYINASWKFGNAEESLLKFMDLNKRREYVKYLTLEGHHLQFTRNGNATYIVLPTVGGCHLTLRHSSDIKDVKPIEAEAISYLINSPEQYIRLFQAPYVKMNKTLNLKDLLKGDLPQVLQSPIKTTLASKPIKIADYIQKITFDMTNKGIEASAATALHGHRESSVMYNDGPRININSPFSFALTRSLNEENYLLFQGQVLDHGPLVRE